MLNKTLIENYLDYFLEKLRISSEHLHHSVLTEFVHKTHHTKHADLLLDLALRVSRMLQGNILVCYAAFVLLHIALFSSTEMCDSLFRNNENESFLAYSTQIFLYRFYEAYIPEFRDFDLAAVLTTLRQTKTQLLLTLM